MARHWSINGRFLIQPLTGVQRYAREIVSSLDRHLTEGQDLTRDLALELLVPEGATLLRGLHAITQRTVPGGCGHVWEQSRLPMAATGGLLSLCNVGPLAKGRHIVCMHDLNTRIAAQSYRLRFRLLYNVLQPALGRSAELVTTVSEFSAAQLVRFGICRSDKIRVIPNGHEHVLRLEPRHTPATEAAAGRNTIVLLGSPAPHKNAGAILSMADALGSMGLRIAVVGAVDPHVFQPERERQRRMADNVAWLGAVDDDALAALLEDSLCLAFPSLTEGFGLPPLEAMALGCPVVVSDRASLPEVCGSAALFAAPTDRDAWLRHFQSLAHDDALRADLIARGKWQAARFLWSDSALSYLDEMARIDARRSPGDGASHVLRVNGKALHCIEKPFVLRSSVRSISEHGRFF